MSEPRPVIVLVEDEPQIRRFLRTVLPEHGYALFEAETGKQGLVEAAVRKPDVVIARSRSARHGRRRASSVDCASGRQVPVIVLSARAQETDKVAALDAGADDYVTKPFGVGELLARLRVALRRTARSEEGSQVFESGALKVDLAARRVQLGGGEVHLTPIEYRLLTVLVRHAGKVLTHRQLLKEVWGPSHIEHSHYLRIYMAQLRKKLEEDPAQPRFLLTEAGVGYRLAVP